MSRRDQASRRRRTNFYYVGTTGRSGQLIYPYTPITVNIAVCGDNTRAYKIAVNLNHCMVTLTREILWYYGMSVQNCIRNVYIDIGIIVHTYM